MAATCCCCCCYCCGWWWCGVGGWCRQTKEPSINHRDTALTRIQTAKTLWLPFQNGAVCNNANKTKTVWSFSTHTVWAANQSPDAILLLTCFIHTSSAVYNCNCRWEHHHHHHHPKMVSNNIRNKQTPFYTVPSHKSVLGNHQTHR